jgi:hypothetical protein
MKRAHSTAFITVLIVALQTGLADRAQADDVPQSVELLEAPTPSVPRECTGRFMAGPAVGIPLGLGVAAFGSVLVSAAAVDLFGSRPSSRSERGAIAGGSIMIGTGLAAFIYSSVKLSKNRRARKRICGSAGE